MSPAGLVKIVLQPLSTVPVAYAPMSKTFAITYHYVPDILERRAPHRPAHLGRLQQRLAEGKLILAGAFADPVDGALLVVEAESAGEVYAWIAGDPYTEAGLITSVDVRETNVAVKSY